MCQELKKSYHTSQDLCTCAFDSLHLRLRVRMSQTPPSFLSHSVSQSVNASLSLSYSSPNPHPSLSAVQSTSTVSSSGKGAPVAHHFPGEADTQNGGSTVTSVQRSAIPPTPPTLEQAMRGDFGFTTSGGATSRACDAEDDTGGGRPYYGSHQFLPPYMLRKHGGRLPGGSQTARMHRTTTDFSMRRASPRRGVSTGGFNGRDSRGHTGSSSPNREISSPPATARARTARPVPSAFGTSGQWPPPSPPQPPSQPKSAKGGGEEKRRCGRG